MKKIKIKKREKHGESVFADFKGLFKKKKGADEFVYAGAANGSALKGRRKLSYERKKSLYGYAFIGIWIVGFIIFFLRPLVGVFQFSFNDIVYSEGGGYTLEWNSFHYWKWAFQQDPTFLRNMVSSFAQMFYNVPLLVVFSLVIGVILNSKFFGRTVARSMFFLPVIITSGIVISIIQGDGMASMVLSGSKGGTMVQAFGLSTFMNTLGLPTDVVNFVTRFANNMFQLAVRKATVSLSE